MPGGAHTGEFPPHPQNARIAVDIDPGADTIRFSWPVLKSKIVLYPFLAFFALWTAVSVFFVAGSLGLIGGVRAPTGVSGVLIPVAAACFVAIGFVFLVPLLRLVLGAKRQVTISPGVVTIQDPWWRITRRILIAEITGVRIATDDDDAIFILRGDRKTRIGLHMPGDDEVAWLTSALRASMKMMGE